MNGLGKDILSALLMGMILPGILLNYGELMLKRTVPEEGSVKNEKATTHRSSQLMLLQGSDGALEEREMDAYLVGVLLAEVPASFEVEALKAQAVAARTYTQKARETGGKHGNGSVCTVPGCCQAWIPEETYLSRGGNDADLQKIRDAVLATSGEVLHYQGELIEATYFSCSGGSTEDAAAVWGSAYPYLRSVESPGEEEAAHYTDTVTFTPQQFQDRLGTVLSGEPEEWFGAVTYTEGGGVASMEIGGQVYTGTQLRSLLGLNSTDFSVTAGPEVTITTYGYGHRVGMSQYGADAMAVAGSTYTQILAHYYPGTSLVYLD